MHNLNVLILGSSSFISTLNELKSFLKFKPLSVYSNDNVNIILFHMDALNDKKPTEVIHNKQGIEIWVAENGNTLNM